MSLNESTVEDAALECFRRRQNHGGRVGALDYAFGHGPLPSRTLATLRDTLLPKLLSGQLQVAN